MNIEELKKADKQLENEISQLAKDNSLSNEDIEPITDGVSDIEAYYNSNPRIMWVLKEPYDDFDEDGNPKSDGWSITKDVFNNKYGYAWTCQSWKPIIYSMYGFLNRISFFDPKMPWVENDNSIQSVLKQIAYINVNKMPSTTMSPKEWCNTYKIWKGIISKQIKLYNPNVIILCGVNDVIDDSLCENCSCGKSSSCNCQKMHIESQPKYMHIYKTEDGRLLIYTYHPGYPKLKNEDNLGEYVNSIISAINLYKHAQ